MLLTRQQLESSHRKLPRDVAEGQPAARQLGPMLLPHKKCVRLLTVAARQLGPILLPPTLSMLDDAPAGLQHTAGYVTGYSICAASIPTRTRHFTSPPPHMSASPHTDMPPLSAPIRESP